MCHITLPILHFIHFLQFPSFTSYIVLHNGHLLPLFTSYFSYTSICSSSFPSPSSSLSSVPVLFYIIFPHFPSISIFLLEGFYDPPSKCDYFSDWCSHSICLLIGRSMPKKVQTFLLILPPCKDYDEKGVGNLNDLRLQKYVWFFYTFLSTTSKKLNCLSMPFKMREKTVRTRIFKKIVYVMNL